MRWYVASIHGKEVEHLGCINGNDPLEILAEAKRRWPDRGSWSVTRKRVTEEDRCWGMAHVELGKGAASKMISRLAEGHATGNPMRASRGEINSESRMAGVTDEQIMAKWRHKAGIA